MHLIEGISNWPSYAEEHVGSKRKAWLLDAKGVSWLFKYPRPGTGEHWAEVVAADVAELLGIPHAHVCLAHRNEDLGTVSRDFTSRLTGSTTLVLGNTLLATVIANYDRDAQKPPHHTVDAVLKLLESADIAPPTGSHPPHDDSDAASTFVGYLMLDALIGNTDRHHENWGLIVRQWKDYVAASQAFFAGSNYQEELARETWELAPTFDHASSLGRDLDDDMRCRRLAGADPRVTVEHYCARGRSPLFSVAEEPKQLSVRQAFQRACECRPEAGSAWLRRCSEIDEGHLLAVVDRLPPIVASDAARAFAKAVLASNREFLCSLPH